MIDEASSRALEAMEADLREAIQHRAAALERVSETQAELEAALQRAAELLARQPFGDGDSPDDREE
jgi:hypothetical protein